MPSLKKKRKTEPETVLTANEFIRRLHLKRSDAELKKYERYFKFSAERPLRNDKFIGVRMGHVFDLAKEFLPMPVKEIEKLMESGVHEVRAGAMSIMGKSASAKKVTPERLQELYELYLRRHDRVNSWDLVDLAAHQVIGRYLADKPRSILKRLARSKDPWERRTAIVSTAHFMMKLKQSDDTFVIAGLMLNEKEELVQKAVGWMLRTAGGPDTPGLIRFLDEHAAVMPRPMLRNALEHFPAHQREKYLGMKKGKQKDKETG